MIKLVNETDVVKEVTLDFDEKTSKWLIDNGFERNLDRFSSPKFYTYRHTKLPLSIKPKTSTIHYGDFEITFIETIYASVNGNAQINPIARGYAKDTILVLQETVNNFHEAFELARKFIARIKKGDYI